MSLSDRLLRITPEPNHDGMRREILLVLEDRDWMDTAELLEAVKYNPCGEFIGGVGVMFSTLHRLTEEGLVEISKENGDGSAQESRTLARLTHYGKDELEQMGADNA